MMTQTILITGANRGIGLGLVVRFLERGDRVRACCRKPEGATRLQQLDSERRVG